MSTKSIFLSHTWADKPFARRLSCDLEKAGAVVWLDEAEIKIGDSLIEKIREGIDSVDYLAVILSPDAVSSTWVQKEVDIAMNQEIKGKQVKVLPLLYKECSLPWFLEGKMYADFTNNEKYPFALSQLLIRLDLDSNERVQNQSVLELHGTWIGGWLHKENKRSALLEIETIGKSPVASMKITYWKNSVTTIIKETFDVLHGIEGTITLKGNGYIFEKQGDAIGWHLDEFIGRVSNNTFSGNKVDSKGRSSQFLFRKQKPEFLAIDFGTSSVAVATTVQDEYKHFIDIDALLTDIHSVSDKHAQAAYRKKDANK